MLIRLVNNIEEFKRILHVTVLCAPNRFAVRDFLDKDEQLTLETAYRDLNYGMQFVVKKVKKPEAVTQVQHILDDVARLGRYNLWQTIISALSKLARRLG
jgi:hypothetical protein